ncbi:MAG: hypothetical protein CMJ50_01240 [Planctomycetaceae bacterium]|nr:hypothetical protein [Planctomycetaceae bacterium]
MNQTNDGVSPNQELLDEVNAAGTWFHAKKVRPIWAKSVDKQQTVKTIEGEETVSAGDFLCRGEIGEIWPQTAAKLQQKYNATGEVDNDGWEKYVPNPDAKGVWAAQLDHTFQVHASWGVLSGKPGDYLVKGYDDTDVDYPEDIWIVDKDLFGATYEKVGP